MDGSGKHLSLMRTLLLLNTTQRKLQVEENIHESESPLKVLQLVKVAKALNDHLHTEEAVQVRTSAPRYTGLSTIPSTIQEERDSFDDDAQALENDRALFELQTTIEVGQASADDDKDSVVEIDEESVSSASSAPRTSDTLYFEDYESEVHELDVTEVDLEDMPELSRLSSHTSIPSLYHSDEGESDVEDSEHDVTYKEQALQGFSAAHDRFLSHPASSLFDKSSHPVPECIALCA